MKLAIVVVIVLLVIAVGGAGYVYQEAQREEQRMVEQKEQAAALAKEVAAAKSELRSRVTAFDDAFKVAGQTSRIALGPVLLRMSDARRAIADSKVPACLDYAKDRASTAAERGTEAIRRFNESDRYTPSSYWTRIHQSYEVAVGEALATLAKACN